MLLYSLILKKMVPDYLLLLLGPCVPPVTTYPLRNHDSLTFAIPQARTTSYLKNLYTLYN